MIVRKKQFLFCVILALIFSCNASKKQTVVTEDNKTHKYSDSILSDILSNKDLRVVVRGENGTGYLSTIYLKDGKYEISFESSGGIVGIVAFSEKEDLIEILATTKLTFDKGEAYFNGMNLYSVQILKEDVVSYLENQGSNSNSIYLELSSDRITDYSGLFSLVSGYSNIVAKEVTTLEDLFLKDAPSNYQINNKKISKGSKVLVYRELDLLDLGVWVNVITETGQSGWIENEKVK